MKSTDKVSVQKVGGGTFRVNAKSGRSAITGRYVTRVTAHRAASTGRSAITGRYVTKATAARHPNSSTSETPTS
jgi:hypothetical protein